MRIPVMFAFLEGSQAPTSALASVNGQCCTAKTHKGSSHTFSDWKSVLIAFLDNWKFLFDTKLDKWFSKVKVFFRR